MDLIVDNSDECFAQKILEKLAEYDAFCRAQLGRFLSIIKRRHEKAREHINEALAELESQKKSEAQTILGNTYRAELRNKVLKPILFKTTLIQYDSYKNLNQSCQTLMITTRRQLNVLMKRNVILSQTHMHILAL